MTLPTPVALGHPSAGWWTRGGALAIDLLITAAIELALLLIVWTISGAQRLTVTEAESLLLEVGLPVAVLYAPLLLARPGEHNGQTLGKQAMRIRVIRDNGVPLSLATAIGRETLGRQLLSLVSYGLYLPIDYLWPLRDPRHQALHDKIARTLVVSAGASLRPRPTDVDTARARSRPQPQENGGPSVEEPVRGDWLPPLAPSPRDPD